MYCSKAIRYITALQKEYRKDYLNPTMIGCMFNSGKENEFTTFKQVCFLGT